MKIIIMIHFFVNEIERNRKRCIELIITIEGQEFQTSALSTGLLKHHASIMQR
jgi:hypothetical protein